ncbi:fibro-slime domain-containing protein [Polyangium sp. y55x31]|uniref:fibro-slime domain-containing protein n=1 Tax=Polyangium sp. y55x31 TaxID=3042688 RepID=UPI0024832A09|nr:fibro-slime domain-containing protein [Polyangium sp. y55x31]MDI1479314.1 fibro-slime domain-containing protein [Polyangium sp. y55x31]
MLRRPFLFASLSVAILGSIACSAGSAGPGGSGGSSGGSGGASSGGSGGEGGLILAGSGGSGGGGGPDKPPAKIDEVLPPGFTAETTYGGWKILGPLEDFNEPSENVCANVLRAIARDFTQAHIDFGQEKPASWTAPGLYMGQILPLLPADRKPDVNPARTPLDVIEGFDDWYRNIDGVNVPFVIDLWLQPDPNKEGYFLFDSNSFFPLDKWNTSPGDVQIGGNDVGPHNFLFTIELHTAFEYKGGEVFNFRGDDDVFVFINDKLAVDIGGIHGPLESNVNLDLRAADLGLTVGNVYKLDLFQAERNPGGSNFRIETSLDFRACGLLPEDVPK